MNISDDGLPTVPGAPAGTLEPYIVRANDSVKWVVRFQAYPSRSTSVVWSKNGERIPENSNRFFNTFIHSLNGILKLILQILNFKVYHSTHSITIDNPGNKFRIGNG